ncbi:MAG: heme o synthase [Pseudomonadota bacterium]
MATPVHTDQALSAESGWGARADAPEAEARDYWLLLKPRVMSLVIFTACVGLLAAPHGVHPVIAIASLLCVAVGAGASGALNMWWDADIDAEMERTRKRPVPAGRISAEEALWVGAALSVLSVALLSVFANAAAAALLALTIAFYLFVYTMWLKRSTPHNVVIGGAAGAFPPMIGWCIATGGIGVEALIMFGIIFMWTPPHSWALALFRNDDYTRVGVPMLPVAAGETETRRQIFIYSVLMAPVAMAPLFTPIAGPLYGLVAGVLTLRFLQLAYGLYRRTDAEAAADNRRAEKKFFGFSILYLFGVFLALLVEAVWRAI